MEYIKVTNENIEKEHICCAISNNNDIQVSSKKAWLSERFEDGLVFLKSTERGKCFIEYIPAENAWNPILADGYMYIDCLWVAGSFKGHGYSTDLLDACIEDSKDVSINTILGSPRQLICQCCGMPLEDSTISKETDGIFNEEYCKWCYVDGKFTYSSMDDLINFCAEHMSNENWTSEQVRVYMKEMLPQLNYWKQSNK